MYLAYRAGRPPEIQWFNLVILLKLCVICSPFLARLGHGQRPGQTVTWVGGPMGVHATQSWPAPNNAMLNLSSSSISLCYMSSPPGQTGTFARLPPELGVHTTLSWPAPNLLSTYQDTDPLPGQAAYYVNSQTHKLFVLGILFLVHSTVFIALTGLVSQIYYFFSFVDISHQQFLSIYLVKMPTTSHQDPDLKLLAKSCRILIYT